MKYGVSVESSKEHEITSLLDALLGNSNPKRAVKLLSEEKMSVDIIINTQEIKGKRTALHLAAQYGHENIVVLLLKRGADASISDNNGRTAFQYAVQFGYGEIAEVIYASCSTTLNHQSDNGETALHIAVDSEQLEIVKWLVSLDSIKIDAVTKDGYTALKVSEDFVHNKEIEDILKMKGAQDDIKPYLEEVPALVNNVLSISSAVNGQAETQKTLVKDVTNMQHTQDLLIETTNALTEDNTMRDNIGETAEDSLISKIFCCCLGCSDENH